MSGEIPVIIMSIIVQKQQEKLMLRIMPSLINGIWNRDTQLKTLVFSGLPAKIVLQSDTHSIWFSSNH